MRTLISLVLLAELVVPAFAQQSPLEHPDTKTALAALREQRIEANDNLVKLTLEIARLRRELEAAKQTCKKGNK